METSFGIKKINRYEKLLNNKPYQYLRILGWLAGQTVEFYGKPLKIPFTKNKFF
jgi:hypothetical protein